MNDLRIIKAEPTDAACLTEIAFVAKRSWNYPEHWISLWSDLLTITPEFIRHHAVNVAVVDEIVGFYALTGLGRTLVLEHLWVLPPAMRRGIGRALFLHAMERAADSGATRLKIEADPHAEGFYERMGARRIGETVTEIDGERRIVPVLMADVVSLA